MSLADIPVVVARDAEPAKARSVQPPARSSVEPYRAYKPQPFTREERDKVTILFGNLHWRAERVMQGVFSNLGYRTQILPTATRADLLAGREVADIGQCCPTSFTTGNLVNTLRNEAKRINAEFVSTADSSERRRLSVRYAKLDGWLTELSARSRGGSHV